MYIQVIEQRKTTHPDRPLVRISSTFFWHLSSDYDLAPLPALADRARTIRASEDNLGSAEDENTLYPPMKVGQQVSKYVPKLLVDSDPPIDFSV